MVVHTETWSECLTYQAAIDSKMIAKEVDARIGNVGITRNAPDPFAAAQSASAHAAHVG